MAQRSAKNFSRSDNGSGGVHAKEQRVQRGITRVSLYSASYQPDQHLIQLLYHLVFVVIDKNLLPCCFQPLLLIHLFFPGNDLFAESVHIILREQEAKPAIL